MKANTITLRMTEDLKSQIEEQGLANNKTRSEVIRIILEDFFNSPENLKDTQSYYNISNRNLDVLQTLSFTELIFWIYDKKIDPVPNETIEFYEKLLKVITSLNSHPLFYGEILNMFNNIAIELKFYAEGNHNQGGVFYFPIEGHKYSFNYQLFNEFFHALRYDDNNNLVLKID